MLASQLVVNLPKFVSGISSWFPDLFSYISVCMYVCMHVYMCATVYVFVLHGLIIILSVSVFIVHLMLSLKYVKAVHVDQSVSSKFTEFCKRI